MPNPAASWWEVDSPEAREARLLPDQVVIGPYTYTIVPMGDEVKNLKGETSADELLIRIAPDLPEGRARATLWHEILHCLFDLVGNPVSEKLEEDLINRLAPALMDVVDRNPKLVRVAKAG